MLFGLIPAEIAPIYRKSEKHFTRNSKLPFPKLITFVLSITSSGKSKGVDSKSGEFIKNARRSGLWPDAEAIHRSTVTKARNKVPWKVFEEIHNDSVKLAYDLWPEDSDYTCYTWKGMSVFAFDGSKYMLPATEDLREEFDPGSGLQNPGKGHYPQCLVSTAYDVFRRLPVGRTVVEYDSSERDEAKLLIPKIPPGNLLVWDRGYPSFEFFKFLNENYDGYYLFRSPASGSFSVVADFIKSMKQEEVVVINPPHSYIYKEESNRQQRREEKPITLRVIRLESPDGTLSVLLTNLMDQKKFSQKEITDLYYRRWEVESYYRDEKIFLDIDTFHSKTSNGIRQELFAALIMSVIARILMITALSLPPSQEKENSKSEPIQSPIEIESRATLPEPQFKNAAMALAADAALLTPQNPEIAAKIFKELLEEIRRVKYYRPKVPRPSKPRITKKPQNKWADRNYKRGENA